jgi:hypothetical protein
MSLDISVKTEARLVAKAREQGLSVDAFLVRLLNDDDMPARVINGEAPPFPARYLGVRGSLHRRDIYNA